MIANPIKVILWTATWFLDPTDNNIDKLIIYLNLPCINFPPDNLPLVNLEIIFFPLNFRINEQILFFLEENINFFTEKYFPIKVHPLNHLKNLAIYGVFRRENPRVGVQIVD